MAKVDRAPAGVGRGGRLGGPFPGEGGRGRDAERWIWRTVFRVAAGELKTRSRSVPMRIERTYEMEEPARELVDALSRLSMRQRAAVVLHHAAGYPIREVAAIVGSTPAAVKVHLMRARRRLRELLEENDD